MTIGNYELGCLTKSQKYQTLFSCMQHAFAFIKKNRLRVNVVSILVLFQVAMSTKNSPVIWLLLNHDFGIIVCYPKFIPVKVIWILIRPASHYKLKNSSEKCESCEKRQSLQKTYVNPLSVFIPLTNQIPYQTVCTKFKNEQEKAKKYQSIIKLA